MEGGPPKIPTFSGSDSERLERGPQCSARRRNFQKPLRTIVVLRSGYIPTGRKCTSSQYPRCPMQKTKKSAVFAQLGVGDDVRGRGTAVFGRRCGFTSGSPSPNAELDFVVSFFENSSVGPRYVAFRTGRFRRNCPKLGNDYVRKGGNFHFHPKISTLFLFEI